MTYIPTERFFQAVNLSSRLHRDHVRKDEHKTPYASHVFGVAMLLASVTDDEDIIIAGLMHDTLEDVEGYAYDDLVRDCGDRVATLVQNVTEDKTLPYKKRKIKYLEHLKTCSPDSVILSVADKLHNSLSFKHMLDDHKHEGHYILYNEVLKIAQEKIDKNSKGWELVERLREEIENN